MTKDSLKRKIKEEGLAGSVLYYLGRFCSKAELALVGKWFGNHGKLRQNCIVSESFFKMPSICSFGSVLQT